jgi:hypothetical protein
MPYKKNFIFLKILYFASTVCVRNQPGVADVKIFQNISEISGPKMCYDFLKNIQKNILALKRIVKTDKINVFRGFSENN